MCRFKGIQCLCVAVCMVALPGLPSGEAQYPNHRRPGSPVVVVIDDGSFTPGTILVEAGDTVQWINVGKHNHTVTAPDKSWGSGQLSTGDSYSYTFPYPGTFAYVCSNHQKMKGSVFVMDVGQR